LGEKIGYTLNNVHFKNGTQNKVIFFTFTD